MQGIRLYYTRCIPVEQSIRVTTYAELAPSSHLFRLSLDYIHTQTVPGSGAPLRCMYFTSFSAQLHTARWYCAKRAFDSLTQNTYNIWDPLSQLSMLI